MRIVIVFLLISFSNVYGQTEKFLCECPISQFAETKPDTAFHLTNGKTIVLCGYIQSGRNPSTYSEFVLAVCGEDKIIDFWDAVLTCQLKVNKDTLLVEQVVNLPIGKNFKFQEAVWSTEKLYFNDQKIKRELFVNRQIEKYSQNEIKQVLKEYKTVKAGIDENKMEIANRLFIATISGDDSARQYLKEFETKFGILDGAFSLEYKELISMLSLWDKK